MNLLEYILAELPPCEREYRFDAVRRFRFDFAWPAQKIALEIEGGTWTQGRHIRPKGYENDCRKYNLATLQGWKVYRATTAMVKSGEILTILEKALEGKNDA